MTSRNSYSHFNRIITAIITIIVIAILSASIKSGFSIGEIIGYAVAAFLGRLLFYGLLGAIGNKEPLRPKPQETITTIFILWAFIAITSGFFDSIESLETPISDNVILGIVALVFGALVWSVILSHKLRAQKCDKRRANAMLFMNYLALIVNIFLTLMLIMSDLQAEKAMPETITQPPLLIERIPPIAPPAMPQKEPEIIPEPETTKYATLADVPGIRKRETGIVTQVVDGDTYTVKTEYGKIVKVRLLGIDFPDVDVGRIKYWTDRGWTQMHVKACYSEGNDIIRSALVTQQVILWSDDMEDEKDAYGRILRYVTRADDPYPINAYLVDEGWAVMSDWGQRACSLCDWLLSLEQEAQGKGKGCLWSST